MDFPNKEGEVYLVIGQLLGILSPNVIAEIADDNILHHEHLHSLVRACKNVAFYAYGQGDGQVNEANLGVSHAEK